MRLALRIFEYSRLGVVTTEKCQRARRLPESFDRTIAVMDIPADIEDFRFPISLFLKDTAVQSISESITRKDTHERARII